MPTKLYTELTQQLATHDELWQASTSVTAQAPWKGRTISKANEIPSRINQLLKPHNTDEITNTQLLDRVFKLCEIDESKQDSLNTLCADSPDEGAKVLAEYLATAIKSDDITNSLFTLNLHDWVTQASEGEKRAEAAEKITQAYQDKAVKIDLSKFGLKTLPDVFNTFTELKEINLDDNHFEQFPKSLYCINQPLTISVDETPLLKRPIPPPLRLKVYKNNWQITEPLKSDSSLPFIESKDKYLKNITNAKKLKINPEDFQKTQQVTHSSQIGGLEARVEEVLLSASHQKSRPIKNQADLQERLSHCHLEKIRFLPCGNDKFPINIFGCARPKIRPNDSTYSFMKKRIRDYYNNLSFVYNEVSTIIALMDRNSDNKPYSFLMATAGNEKHHPTKALSIPISDFAPPRFEHYSNLAKEMKSPFNSATQKPKGILIFCSAGEGRTGTLLAASQVLDRFNKLDNESKKQLLNPIRSYTPDIFGGTFSHLKNDFKTTEFVGDVVQHLRQLEQETTEGKVGISVETPEQFQTLEILQCMLAISEKLNEIPPITDEQILDVINEKNFNRGALEEFFQIDYSRPAEEVILESVKQLHASFSKTSE